MAESQPDAGAVTSIYSESGIGARVGFGARPGLLVVDMTVAFCDPAYAVGSDQGAALTAIRDLLDVARERSVPTFFATTSFPSQRNQDSPFVTKIPGLRELTADTAAATTVHPSLHPRPGERVINKEHPSCFFGTNLAAELVLARIDTLIVTGCSTSGCIRATVVDAASHGYRVIIPRECVSDRAASPHEANLFDMDMKYADVMASDEVVEALRERRGQATAE